MTDYEIQKDTAAKVGVESSPENIFECRKAILEKLGGDSTDADTIYECDMRILPLIGGGSANLQSKSVDIVENGTTTYSPDSGFDGFSDFSVNVNVPPTPTQEKSVNITENGTTSIVPDAGYNLSSVNVTVNVNAQGSLKLVNGTKLAFSDFTVCPDYDFSDITDMNKMFYSCFSLTSIQQLDTSNATDMNMMFSECTELTSISQLDTSKVSNMEQMFYGCSSLTSIPQLDTSNVLSILSMFNYCDTLSDLGGFVNLGKAFRYAETLDLSTSFDLTNQSVQNIIDTVYDMNQNTQGGSATLKLDQSVIDAMSETQKSQLAAKKWTLTN